MLFSFRLMMVITLLAGLVPLTVAAPLYQMEDGVVDIVRRGGVPIHKTAVYKGAKTDADKKKVMDHAKRLIEQENARHAKTDGLINADTHHSNVLFHEASGGLHKAQFIDWSHTKKA